MIVYLICYLASFLTAMMGHYYFSGIFLIGAAVYLYVREFRRTGNCIHLRGIFSLAGGGGPGNFLSEAEPPGKGLEPDDMALLSGCLPGFLFCL